MIEFRKISEFPRGTLYDILQDAYSYDARNKEIWDENWHESDDFFYDNPVIADKYGMVTCIDDYPIGFVTWDPRNAPEYVEIGHNGIRSAYKRKGYGHLQLQEAIRRIKSYDGLKRIIVLVKKGEHIYGFKEGQKTNLWFIDSGVYFYGMCLYMENRMVALWFYGFDRCMWYMRVTFLEMSFLWKTFRKSRECKVLYALWKRFV